ncbi:MAG: peptidylprolyl isomerase [Porticoccaceae bacterium]
MNIYKSFAALLLLLTGIQTAIGQGQEIDRVIAIVDDSVVLSSELESRLEDVKSRLGDQPQQLPADDVLREQILERLIIENIQLQMADRYGINPSENQVSQSFAQMANSQGLTPEALINEMNAQGESVSALMRQIRRELTLQQVRQAVVNNRIEITEAEIDNFLRSTEGQFWQSSSLNLQHIQIGLSSDADPGQVASAQNTANTVIEKLEAGEPFEAMAVQYSNASTALDGGSIGWRRSMEFPAEIREALEQVEAGEYTEPVRSSGGIHIFKVLEERGGVSQQQMVEQTKTRHILVIPNEIRTSEETRELAENLRQRVIDGESFEELAAEYSEDISNSLKGGDLGWVLPGQMVPHFEAAMNDTEVGEVSPPVETQFGWHILQVDDRREVDMTNEIIRNQAYSVLHDQQFPEELDLWLREIRGNAFVSILN